MSFLKYSVSVNHLFNSSGDVGIVVPML